MIRDFALLAARLAVGGGIAAHGSQKALGWFDGMGPAGAAKMMERLGLRPNETYAALAAWNEIAAGLLIAAGLGGPAGPSMLLSGMIVAHVTTAEPKGFFDEGGTEVRVLYSAAALALAAHDYGALSADALLGLRKPLGGPLMLALALAAAVTGAALVLGQRDTTPPGPATPTFRGKNSPLPEQEPAAT